MHQKIIQRSFGVNKHTLASLIAIALNNSSRYCILNGDVMTIAFLITECTRIVEFTGAALTSIELHFEGIREPRVEDQKSCNSLY